MRRFPLLALFWLSLTMVAIASANLSAACPIPVFRYALERWQPDVYGALIFHRGPLPDDLNAVMAKLDPQRENADTFANILVKTVDLDNDPEPYFVDVFEKLEISDEDLPWMMVKYPVSSGIPRNVFSGQLEASVIKQLTSSPARQKLADELTGGKTAVWILLECGDKAKDDLAFETLSTRLAALETEIELPELEESELAEWEISGSDGKLAVEFSIVRVGRDDPTEEMFVKILLDTEQDLVDLDGPMAFPVFGQGRALYALVDKGINNDTIDDAAHFLTGPCSCQIKDQNPGVDLLMSVDWLNMIQSRFSVDRELPELAGIPGLSSETTIPTSTTNSPDAPSETRQQDRVPNTITSNSDTSNSDTSNSEETTSTSPGTNEVASQVASHKVPVGSDNAEVLTSENTTVEAEVDRETASGPQPTSEGETEVASRADSSQRLVGQFVMFGVLGVIVLAAVSFVMLRRG